MPELSEVQARIEDLRQRSAVATTEELEALLNDSRRLLKDAFQTEHEEDARKLFRELRARVDSGDSTRIPTFFDDGSVGVDFPKHIAKARLQSESNSSEDISLAIQTLIDILKRVGPDDTETRLQVLDILQTIASKGKIFGKQIADMIKPSEIRQTQSITDLLKNLSKSEFSQHYLDDQPIHPPGRENEQFSSSSSTSIIGNNTVFEKLADARRKYYAGEYYAAIDVLSEVLRLEPENAEARKRLDEAEDNIIRGIVPDTRVPYEARVAFGRGQSLERAHKFEDAKFAYTLALEEARKGGPELTNWPAAIEALLRIEQEIIAEQTRDEANEYLRQDKWREAIGKYEIVLKLSPDDSKAKQNIELLRTVQQQYEKARIQLTAMSGSLGEMAQLVLNIQVSIQILRPQMPDSRLLTTIDEEIKAKANNLKNRMVDRANSLLIRVTLTPSIIERKRMLLDAVKILDQAVLIAPDDNAYELSLAASLDLAKISDADKGLADARRLINSSTEQDARLAKQKLHELREFNQDPVFRQLVNLLLRQYLNYAEDNLQEKRYEAAALWIKSTKENIFKGAESFEDVKLVDKAFEQRKKNNTIKRVAYIFGVLFFIIATIIVFILQIVK